MLAAETMREAIALHLRGLSEECRRVLGVASVLGQTFATSVLGTVLEIPGARVLASIDEAR